MPEYGLFLLQKEDEMVGGVTRGVDQPQRGPLHTQHVAILHALYFHT